MDNPYYEFSAINARPPLRWPDDRPVALCVIVSAEHYDWALPPGAYAISPGGIPFQHAALTDVRTYTHREYGNRVGIFRVMDTLDKYGIRATIAIDATVADQYPILLEHAQKRGYEFICHGMAVTQMVTSRMSEDEERAYIRTALSTVSGASGTQPAGWLGPEYGASARTPDLLAEAGIRYVCDWPNDEQPYRMKVSSGALISLPILLDLDDVVSHYVRHVPIMRYGQLLKEAFDGLRQSGRTSGRLMTINIHPWLIGQPFRIPYLDDALAYIIRSGDAWSATGSEIVDWYARSSGEQ
jgi:peptidoglycan/xylan/chitin deacetylase (PgdA/CDA1 family)